MKLFDLHCDTLYRAYTENGSLFDDRFHISFRKSGGISPYIQCLAVWIPDEYRNASAMKLFEVCTGLLRRELQNSELVFCRTAEDLQAVSDNQRTGVVLTVEGGAVLGGQLENLRVLREAGVQMMTLTWNGANELGDGVGVENAKGLTAFGRQVVREMERLHMIVDVSHASEGLFRDVAEISTRPFVASHSDAKSICDHRRNLTDQQFCEIRDRGGLVGLNFCVDFLNKYATNAKMCDIIKNAEHFLSLGGEKILAMGGDFDGADIPADMRGIDSMPALYEMFLRHYSEELVEDIFFGNAIRFFQRNMDFMS